MMLRIQAERLAGLQLDLEEYKAGYQLTEERLAAHAPEALVMHPGPIIRGLELTGEVADGPQSLILEQVHHGVAIRMALVYRAYAAGAEGGGRMSTILIRGGHLIDPAAGVDALKDIVLKDGRVAELPSREDDAGQGEGRPGSSDHRRQRTDGRAGTGGYSCASARAGPGAQGDHCHRHGSRGRGRIYFSCGDAQYHAHQRFAGDHALDAGSGTRRFGACLSPSARLRGRKGEVLNDYAALKAAEWSR
jgi:hypothetical protein